MRKLVYYVGMTLDGYIAGPDGGIEFFPLPPDFTEWIGADYPETLPTHAQPHFGVAPGTPNKNFDTLVMGRGTYEPGLAVGITSPYSHMRQYVVSTTLERIEDPAVELVSSDPVALVRRLKQEDGMDIWLAGGGKLAGALIDEIDELIIKSYPVSAGAGIRAFDGPFRPTLFTPSKRREFSNGTQVTWLTRA
ncbi:dihydrofolate reductase family protein [Nocardia cyriacigeorgica]|uniref:dihydrofolate reductase family protein n=1 Tax=Nocardia cyriacigeorgica TaxID=135487 RepID=UPI00245585C5|nr:dihydrofolate reductase family protein [Nocardia cyriacigeorgica]